MGRATLRPGFPVPIVAWIIVLTHHYLSVDNRNGNPTAVLWLVIGLSSLMFLFIAYNVSLNCLRCSFVIWICSSIIENFAGIRSNL